MGTDSLEITDALDRLEAELHQLNGLLSVLKIVGEAADGIEPVAIAALARASECSMTAAMDAWRLAHAAAHQRSTQ